MVRYSFHLYSHSSPHFILSHHYDDEDDDDNDNEDYDDSDDDDDDDDIAPLNPGNSWAF